MPSPLLPSRPLRPRGRRPPFRRGRDRVDRGRRVPPGRLRSPFLGEDGSGPGPAGSDTAGRGRSQPYDFAQGELHATGRELDLAIEGRGFFILRNREGWVYLRRPAMFALDAEGRFHPGDEGLLLQGIRLSSGTSDKDPHAAVPVDSTGRADLSSLESVRYPGTDVLPARATTRVKLTGRLDADAPGNGALLYSRPFLHHAEGSDRLIGLKGSGGRDLGLRAGDVLTLSALPAQAGAGKATAAFTVTRQSTLDDLAVAMQTFFRSAAVGAGLGTTVKPVTAAGSATLRGALTVYGNSAPIREFRLASDRSESDPRVGRPSPCPRKSAAARRIPTSSPIACGPRRSWGTGCRKCTARRATASACRP